MTPRLSPFVPIFERPITTSGIMIAIPCYGGMIHDACLHGLLESRMEFARLGLPWNIVTVRNESLVQRARNTCVAHFLASSCDRLVFVDADIGFTAAQLLRLLAHDRDLVAGLYRKKRLEAVDFAVNWLPGTTARRDPATGAVEAAAVATGFLAIKRGVFDRMIAAFPQARYVINPGDGAPGAWRDHTHALFDCWIDPITRGYLSEDYAFCARWRALGGEVWADPGLILEHHGSLCLTADPMAGLTVASSAEPAPFLRNAQESPASTPAALPLARPARAKPASTARKRRA